MSLPDGLIAYGPDANCTLAICPVEASVYQYRPSVPANAVLLALFGVCGLLHTYQGIRYRAWWYMTAMQLGCICEILGYIGRLMLYHNPFSFNAFLLQICKLARFPPPTSRLTISRLHHLCSSVLLWCHLCHSLANHQLPRSQLISLPSQFILLDIYSE